MFLLHDAHKYFMHKVFPGVVVAEILSLETSSLYVALNIAGIK